MQRQYEWNSNTCTEKPRRIMEFLDLETGRPLSASPISTESRGSIPCCRRKIGTVDASKTLGNNWIVRSRFRGADTNWDYLDTSTGLSTLRTMKR